MPRLLLKDALWSKLKIVMLGLNIYNTTNLRLTVEGVLYRLRTGCPWRDLPDYFGRWESVYKRFNEWSKNDKLIKLFKNLIENPDLEWKFIDGSIVKAHQHSSGGSKKEDLAIGKSVAGNSTKIHMCVDSFGLPIEFDISEGQVHDSKLAIDLIEKTPTSYYVIADRGYDSEEIRERIREAGSIPIIPRRLNNKRDNSDIDWHLYKLRHLVENVFARLKHFRAIATRYDKLKRNYKSMVALACAYIWLPL